MSRPGTSRLKVNPPLGTMPVLQFVQPVQLKIDDKYQRSLDTGPSKTLIRKIAQFWNWDLCQPLVVARRDGGELFVIDGQHRLEAARMRGDIQQLPCVVVQYANRADEAASFVHLNQQRRPLTKLDIFKAAVASEDPEACAILKAIEDAGLSVAPHSNYTSWKPGMISNIGGVETAWRRHGKIITSQALTILAKAFPRQRLQFAGTIFPGIVAVAAKEFEKSSGEFGISFIELLRSRSQKEWRAGVMRARADDPNLRYNSAVEQVFLDAWSDWLDRSYAKKIKGDEFKLTVADDDGEDERAWCGQCDRRVTKAYASRCISRFCSLKVSA